MHCLILLREMGKKRNSITSFRDDLMIIAVVKAYTSTSLQIRHVHLTWQRPAARTRSVIYLNPDNIDLKYCDLRDPSVTQTYPILSPQ